MYNTQADKVDNSIFYLLMYMVIPF